jgi:hypothetical protein
MIPPVVSLGNNGDFGKISGHFSIGYPPDQENSYAPVKFQREPRYEYHAEFRTSENLLAIAAVGLSALVSKSGEFDIRAIGAIHGALFLLSIWLLLPVLAFFFPPLARIFLLLAIALVLCDVMYVSVFNSFYMDAAALGFAPLAVVFFLRSLLWRRAWDLLGLALSCALLAGSKPQHAILAIPLLAVLFIPRKPAFAWAAAALLIFAAWYTIVSVPPDYRRNPLYNIIFVGLLPHSSAPAADLAELGLEPADLVYSGTSGFHATGGFSHPEFIARFNHIGAATLLCFYAHHPVRAWQLFVRGFDDAGATRPTLGNFDPAEGFPPFFQSQAFALWSRLRNRLFDGLGWRFLFFTLALQVILLARAAKTRWSIAALCLTAAVFLEAAISGFGDVVESARHFTIFMQMQDISLLALLASLLPCHPEDSFTPESSTPSRLFSATSGFHPAAAGQPSPNL